MNNYSITFKSLRAGTVYTLNIGGGTGAAIPLKGGAQPFTTEEDNSEDMFTPIRTQTGYIRVVDDGKDYNGNSIGADWWKDLIPATDTSRPVSLTNGNGTVVWQGFMQAQSFSGVLYGNPQEREFPVQCVLSVLSTTQINTSVVSYQNFAYLLNHIFSSIPGYNDIIDKIVIQGGADARSWLRMKLDWRNFMNVSEGEVSPNYNLFQILEDICRYWGWTARTHGQQILLCAVDDRATEPNALVLTRSQLVSIGAGDSGDIGTVETMYSAVTIGTNFASMDNEDTRIRGYSKAVVKVDANSSQSEMRFAPASLETSMESLHPGYQWFGDPDNSMIGYFTTTEMQSFASQQTRIMTGGSSNNGGFSRRQIYSTEDATSPDIVDCIDIRGPYSPSDAPKAWLESTYEMSFPGGSFEMKATLYEGWKKTEIGGQYRRRMKMAIGIGANRNNAQWLNLGFNNNDEFEATWGSKQVLDIQLMNIPTLCPCLYTLWGRLSNSGNIPLSRIPVHEGLFGRIFVEFYGSPDVDYQRIGKPNECNFEIADFTISFSRDAVSIVDSRTRSAIKKRYGSREYSATASNQASDTYNVDCIFAADNEMDYGYGLLMNADGTFMANAPYNGTNALPEQHLVNRIAAFYNQSHRVIYAEMQNVTTTPRETTTVDSTTCYPISISHDWRDDVTMLTLIQI